MTKLDKNDVVARYHNTCIDNMSYEGDGWMQNIVESEQDRINIILRIRRMFGGDSQELLTTIFHIFQFFQTHI